MMVQNPIENFKKMPKISIMLLTYNRAKLLPRAIKSVLNQTFSDFELIIINNGAIDNTDEIVKSFNDRRIVYKKFEKNQGILGGFNAAFDLATGKYVTNLSDDDEFVPDAFETFSDKFDELSPKGIKMLWFDCIDVEAKRYSGSGLKKEGYVSYDDYLCNRITGDYQAVTDRDVIGNNRFNPDTSGLMTDIFGLKCHRNNKAYHIPKIVCKLYREHGESRASMEETLLSNEIPRIVFTMKYFIKEYGKEMREKCPKCYGKRLASLGFYQILNREKKEGRINALKALKYRFSFFHLCLYIFSFVLTSSQIKYICLAFFRTRRVISNFLKKISKPVTI
jgi:glycosyltransferase involved in cell wall biosynthesis